jgi:tRNA A-37 threonylcarbamoyl transferase component Bud32
LHEDGFVHGDIRGFNTVFSENEGEGWLIDFDFWQGSTTNNCSPEATNYLDDGMRCENMRSVKQVARLVRIGTIDFYCHSFDPPPTELITGNSD